jgi:PhoPQ-activated pathogenicity-related protein
MPVAHIATFSHATKGEIMSKLIPRLLITFAIALALNTNAYAAMWNLVAHQYTDGKWICTYELQASQPPVRMTIIGPMTGCDTYIEQ